MFFSDSVLTIAQTRAQIAVTDDTERPCDKRFRLNVWTMACWSTEWNLSMQLVAVETMSKGGGADFEEFIAVRYVVADGRGFA